MPGGKANKEKWRKQRGGFGGRNREWWRQGELCREPASQHRHWYEMTALSVAYWLWWTCCLHLGQQVRPLSFFIVLWCYLFIYLFVLSCHNFSCPPFSFSLALCFSLPLSLFCTVWTGLVFQMAGDKLLTEDICDVIYWFGQDLDLCSFFRISVILPRESWKISKSIMKVSQFKVQGFFICHIINYTGYNQK